MRWILALGVLALAAGCEPTNRPTMNPGQDCISCHQENAPALRIRFTAAGTVFNSINSTPDEGVAGAHVFISDSSRRILRLTSNSVGNFYTIDPLDLDGGLTVAVEYQGHCRVMSNRPKPYYTYEQTDGTVPNPPEHGIGCNHCHTDPPTLFGTPNVGGARHAPGRLAVPQYFEPLAPGLDAQGESVLFGVTQCILPLPDGGKLDVAPPGGPVFDP